MFDMKNLYESSQASLSEKETRLEKNVEINISKAVSSKKKKNKSEQFDIKPKLLNLRFRILNNHITEFSCTTKKARSSTKEDLRRRSKYIGVSKNNSNWQALINVNHSKKYIGTFANEVQAARAFDLYSVAMRGDKASLNFSYTPEEMLERIEYFLEHSCVKFDS
uniref:AP2/ERF domain-containing protein n=1 Tax=Euplotes crassus TaxID=5936 RepID=A0A7S3K814_EUPCR|mmetsp:Transcript_14293/g.14271  ORF Transcript_14293/g.14271 Transcript_14293/m.14271 type:complete len:165 (+) Transcript_14293:200-694(+)